MSSADILCVIGHPGRDRKLRRENMLSNLGERIPSQNSKLPTVHNTAK